MHVLKVEQFLRSADLIDYETPCTLDGCTVRRAHAASGRYIMDCADQFTDEGWMQYDTDQDASYFGVWVNPRKFMTVSYAEGDWTLVECLDRERYNREIKRMNDYYDEGEVCYVIDQAGMTVYKQNRERFFCVDKIALSWESA